MAEMPVSGMAVYSARPTVRIDTQEYPRVSELIVAMEMTEHEGGMSSLELHLTNVASSTTGGADLSFEDDQILKLGARIAVYSGAEGSPREIFRGIMTGLEAEFPEFSAPELVVLAEDLLQQARMSRRTQIHDRVSISSLAQDLAGQLGLTPVITGFTDVIGTQVQLNESDLAFLRRLLQRYEGDLQVVGTELHISPRSDVRRGNLELALASQLRRVRVLADLSHQVTEATAGGWDPVGGKRVSGRSTGAHLGPGTGRTGAQVLQRAIGARSQHVGDLTGTSDAEAQALADAAFDHAARRFLVVEGTATGNAALRVGTTVKLTGLGPRFENTYYVTRACHRFDTERGYLTDFEAECAYWGGE